MTGPVTPLDEAALTALVEAAEAATPGPWFTGGSSIRDADREGVASTSGWGRTNFRAGRDAKHIAAASPDVMIALVSEIRTQRNAAISLRRQRDRTQNEVNRLRDCLRRMGNAYRGPGDVEDAMFAILMEAMGEKGGRP